MTEKYWIGGAESVAQVATISVDNTWATSDTAVITCNGKSLTLTVGATATTTAIATAIKEMINGDTITGDATRSNTGNNIAEFTEFTATVNSSTVTITGDTKGKPFTISVSETTAGTGVLTLTLEATAATGPNHWSDADNWSTGSVPVNSDDVVIDGRSEYDIKYGLDQSSVVLTSLSILNSYTGKIGLPFINKDSSTNTYPEYRGTYLQVATSALTISGKGTGSGRIKINVGSGTAATMDISSRGTSAENGIPAVLIQGTNASNVARITRGDVGFAFYDGESATLSSLQVGYEENQAGDVVCRCGDGASLTSAAVTQSGGELYIETTTSSGTITQTDGKLYCSGSAAHASITANGSLYYSGTGTITTLESYGGTVDFRQGTAGVTLTNATIGRQTAFYDPGKRITFTNGLDITCAISELQALDLGKYLTIQRSAI